MFTTTIQEIETGKFKIQIPVDSENIQIIRPHVGYSTLRFMSALIENWPECLGGGPKLTSIYIDIKYENLQICKIDNKTEYIEIFLNYQLNK